MARVYLSLLLLGLLHRAPAQHHGGQYFFSQQQQQPVRFFPQQFGSVRPAPEPTPSRASYYSDQDPNTSDVSHDFYQQRPFAQFNNFPQVSSNEPYSFQDQRFGHFQGLLQQPVTTRAPVIFNGFNTQYDQQRRPQQFQQPTPAPPPPAPPRQVQLAARFPTPVQTLQHSLEDQHFRSQEIPQGNRQAVAPNRQSTFRGSVPPPRQPTSQVQQSYSSSLDDSEEEELPQRVVRPQQDRGRVRATTEADVSDYDSQAFRGNRLGGAPVRSRTSTTRREKPLPTPETVTRRPDRSRVEVRRRPVQPLPFVDPQEPEASYERHEKTVVTSSNSYVRASPTTPVPKFTNFVTQRAQHRLRVPFETDSESAPHRLTTTTTTTTSTTTPKPTTTITRDPELQSEETHRGVFPSKEEEEEAEEELEYEYATEEESQEEEEVSPTTTPVAGQMVAPDRASPDTTESWVVVASVQTSRSVSGARFLPAGIVSQKVWNDTLGPDGLPMTNSTTAVPTSSSTESIIDKLDQVQSELSSGIFSGGFRNSQLEVLPAMPMADKEIYATEAVPSPPTSTTTTSTTTTTTTTTTAAPSTTEQETEDSNEDAPFVRKFSPSKRTSTAKPKKSSLLDNLQFDDLAGLLPPGFKPRNSKKPSSTTAKPDTPRIESPRKIVHNNTFKPKIPKKKSNIENSIVFNDEVSSLLPAGYKAPENKTDSKLPLDSVLSKVKFEDVSSLLPAGYKPDSGTTRKPEKSNLLAGLKFDTPKDLLPPGFKPESEPKPAILSKIKFETPAGLLPPGFKPEPEHKLEKTNLLSSLKFDTPKELLPPGFKPDSEPKPAILSKIKFETPAGLLPPGFKVPSETVDVVTTTVAPVAKAATTAANKIVLFPGGKGPASRKPFGRQTTEKSSVAENLPEAPKIQKGWPIRATTAFTGWPTPPTTPISIEKLLELARAATSTSSPTSVQTTTEVTTPSTTTSTTTQRPTTPGVCRDGCELAGTVKLVGGAQWQPELLDPRTKEWQELANEVAEQLDEIYRKSDVLSPLYKGVRIESFSKGSVLVDYFVELEDQGKPISTSQMKTLFHQSLPKVNVPASDDVTNAMSNLLKLGRYIIDPASTDFIVVEPAAVPSAGMQDEDSFLPQWAIAVIVIGLASLLFVIIFGVTVMVSRHKNNKARNPTPLTEDIIKEMNKHHMSAAMADGLDNFGADRDDLYGMDDVWNDKPYERPHKKRSHGSFADNSMTNLYDSWRSDWHGYERSYSHYPPTPAAYPAPASTHHYPHTHRPVPDYDTNF